MQHADQSEQAACGVEIEPDLARQSLHQDVGALVVQRTPRHVERLDAVGRRGADGGVVTVADRVVVLDAPPQRGERKEMRDHRRAVGAADVEHEAASGDAQMQRERAAVVVLGRKGVVLEQVVDRDRTLVLDVGVGAADRILIERDRDETLAGFLAGSAVQAGLTD
jgi:hypothetical protein